MVDTPTQSLAGYFTCHVDDVLMTLQSQGGVALTITADGRLLPGPGLSVDDATQQAAALLVKHYEAAVQRVAAAAKPAADEIDRLRAALGRITAYGTIAGMHEQDRADRLRDIARAALEARP